MTHQNRKSTLLSSLQSYVFLPSSRDQRIFAGLVIFTLTLGLMFDGGIGTRSAYAQAAATPPTATSAPIEPASPAKLGYAREIVVSSGMVRSFNSLIPQVLDQIDQTMSQTRPEIQKPLRETMTQMLPELMKLSDDMTTIAANIFAKHMSEQELKDTAAFFSSPSGKKYVETQPQNLDEIVAAMQGWSQKLSVDILARVREEMKKKGIDL